MELQLIKLNFEGSNNFPDVDISHCVKVLNDANYTGYISTEYEAGGDPVEGTLILLEDVVAALRS